MGLDQFWWEAEYRDGTIYSEATGGAYKDINREQLRFFRLRDGHGPIVELEAEYGRTGWNLVWRRRLAKLEDGTKQVYLLGWVPQGPLYAVDTEDEKVYQAEQFIKGHPLFYPPVPVPYQGERWPVRNRARIINPAAESV